MSQPLKQGGGGGFFHVYYIHTQRETTQMTTPIIDSLRDAYGEQITAAYVLCLLRYEWGFISHCYQETGSVQSQTWDLGSHDQRGSSTTGKVCRYTGRSTISDPSKDSNFVQFGNFKDLKNIIGSRSILPRLHHWSVRKRQDHGCQLILRPTK